MADSSINAFLRCMIDLENENETSCLAEYATYEAVLKRFDWQFLAIDRVARGEDGPDQRFPVRTAVLHDCQSSFMGNLR